MRKASDRAESLSPGENAQAFGFGQPALASVEGEQGLGSDCERRRDVEDVKGTGAVTSRVAPSQVGSPCKDVDGKRMELPVRHVLVEVFPCRESLRSGNRFTEHGQLDGVVQFQLV